MKIAHKHIERFPTQCNTLLGGKTYMEMTHICSNTLKLLVLTCLTVGIAFSQEDSLRHPSKVNIVYAELAGISASINYERLINNSFSLRAGLGTAAYIKNIDGATITANGLLTMAYYSFPEANSRMEIGLGGSLMNTTEYLGSEVPFLNGIGWRVAPSFALGYRYQLKDGGFFFRVGLTYVYLFGGPIQISLGKTF